MKASDRMAPDFLVELATSSNNLEPATPSVRLNAVSSATAIRLIAREVDTTSSGYDGPIAFAHRNHQVANDRSVDTQQRRSGS